MISIEILARSLAMSISGQTYECIIYVMRRRERTISQFAFVKNRIDVSFLCVCLLLTMNFIITFSK